MKYLKYIIPVILTIGAVAAIAAPSLTVTNPEKLKAIASNETIKGYNSVAVYEDGGYDGFNFESTLSEVNKEIEISAEEIKEVDVDSLIGANEPFNIRFITEEDVIKSITSILVDNNFGEDLFGSEYLPYVVRLRHEELTNLVSEKDSEVLEVAQEYQDKLSGGN